MWRCPNGWSPASRCVSQPRCRSEAMAAASSSRRWRDGRSKWRATHAIRRVLGSTDVFAEASVLSLYDPDRSKAPRKGAEIPDWGAFEAALLARLGQEHNRQGEGLAILTARITCPALTSQIAALQKSMPQAKWYRADPIEDDAARNGATLAFGRTVTALPRFADARVALMLDADPIGPGPAQIRFARDITGARQLRTADDFLPHLRRRASVDAYRRTGGSSHSAGPGIDTQCGARHRPRTRRHRAECRIARRRSELTGAVAADLKSRLGRAIVLAGPRQPAEVHALCHWINGTLRAPVDFIEPVDAGSAGRMNSLRALAADIHSGATQTLIIIDTNPAYEAPHEIELAEAIAGVPFSVHLGPYDDETAARCTWHLPLSHPLESWSDLRAFDGTASIVQPLIRPLYDTRTAHELIALLGGAVALSSHDIVRANWQVQSGTADFTAWWRQTLQDGVVADAWLPKLRHTLQSYRRFAGRRIEQFHFNARSRPSGLGRPYGQQCLAAGMSQAIHQGGVGQCHANVSGGWQTLGPS